MTDIKENIEQSLELLFKVERQPPKKKLLLDKPKTIYLQIGLFKLPYVSTPIKKYLVLRHSFHGDEPEICLFVPNRKTKIEYKITTDEFVDFCVDYYTELLEKHKIKGITTIMPLKQLKSEYAPYEMRRKLVHRYDLFLCKNSLLYNPRFISSLGKIFRQASREPLGVSFPIEGSDFDPEFQKSIDRAVLTTSFVIKRGSDNYTIPIGSLSNSKSELKENLETVLDQLMSKNMIPGGIRNVRIMNLWPSQSKPIPLFINPELPPKDIKPRAKRNRKRKMPIGVEGEISTQPGKKVVVMPNGEVFVTSIEDQEKLETDSEGDDSFKDDSEEEDEEEPVENEKLKLMTDKDEEKSESEDDEEIEEREQRLLREKIKADGKSFKNRNSIKDEDEEDEKEGSMNGESETPKKKKMEKTMKGKNLKKSNRKMKQEQFKAKEKMKEKIKSKLKKV